MKAMGDLLGERLGGNIKTYGLSSLGIKKLRGGFEADGKTYRLWNKNILGRLQIIQSFKKEKAFPLQTLAHESAKGQEEERKLYQPMGSINLE